jgi:hypothetical protein
MGQKQPEIPKGQVRHYVYKTTCLPTGRYYYGVHSERRKSDGYIGCGVCSYGTAINLQKKGVKSVLIDSVIKYGYNNFRKEILIEIDNIDDAYEIESLIVDKEQVSNPDCMNTRLGGVGGKILSTCKPVTIIDCADGSEKTFESQADCAHFLGLKNISGKKRMCGGRYVKKEFSEPVSLKTIDGEHYEFKDIHQCVYELGLKKLDKLKQVLSGERNSTQGLFRSDFDFSSPNYHGVKVYKGRKGKY